MHRDADAYAQVYQDLMGEPETEPTEVGRSVMADVTGMYEPEHPR